MSFEATSIDDASTGTVTHKLVLFLSPLTNIGVRCSLHERLIRGFYTATREINVFHYLTALQAQSGYIVKVKHGVSRYRASPCSLADYLCLGQRDLTHQEFFMTFYLEQVCMYVYVYFLLP